MQGKTVYIRSKVVGSFPGLCASESYVHQAALLYACLCWKSSSGHLSGQCSIQAIGIHFILVLHIAQSFVCFYQYHELPSSIIFLA
jgi:hypothetical protein